LQVSLDDPQFINLAIDKNSKQTRQKRIEPKPTQTLVDKLSQASFGGQFFQISFFTWWTFSQFLTSLTTATSLNNY
jgi:hypothetical protein